MSVFPLRRRIGIIASAGGHLSEALKATSSLRAYPRFYVTFHVPHLPPALGAERTYFVEFPRIDPWRYLVNAAQSLAIYLRERPLVIITTGGGTAVPFCLIGRLFGSKIVFVESGSRVVRPSRASRLLYPISHLTLVQWPALLSRFPRAVYVGALL